MLKRIIKAVFSGYIYFFYSFKSFFFTTGTTYLKNLRSKTLHFYNTKKSFCFCILFSKSWISLCTIATLDDGDVKSSRIDSWGCKISLAIVASGSLAPFQNFLTLPEKQQQQNKNEKKCVNAHHGIFVRVCISESVRACVCSQKACAASPFPCFRAHHDTTPTSMRVAAECLV